MSNAAVYHTHPIQEYVGNALIEALPPLIDDKNLIKKLVVNQTCLSEERDYPNHIRKKLTLRLYHFTQPFPEWVEFYRIVENGLLEGYAAKNPFSPTTQHFLHFLDSDDTDVQPRTGRFRPRGSAATLIGVSGVGKSFMLENVLKLFPQVIQHRYYQGKMINIAQLVWLYVDCPHDSSLKSFCFSILEAMDEVLGSNYTEENKNATIEKLQTIIKRKVRMHFVGMIVIDEIQNLNIGKSGGDNKFLKFLLNLINRSGVPFIFSGNPSILAVLKKKFRTARRSEAGGLIQMEALSPDIWELFIRRMWRLQWTNPYTRLTKELSQHLFHLSQGLPDIAVRIYRKAQELAIGSGDERITAALMEEAYNRECVLTSEALDLVRRNDPLTSILYDDLVLAEEDGPEPRAEPECIEVDEAKELINGDVTRVQHKEFANQLNEIRNNHTFLNQVEDPDILRRAAELKDPLKALRNKGYVLDDMLTISG